MSGEHGFTNKQIANLTGIPYRVIAGGSEFAFLNPEEARKNRNRRHREAMRVRRQKRLEALMKILDRDGWRCGICFGQIYERDSWNEFTAPNRDHIWPRALWRPYQFHWAEQDVNLRAAHSLCNTQRGIEWDYDRDWAALVRNGLPVSSLPVLRG